ncbi:MAG: arginase family protein [Phycisphaerae bacterium]|nr:arginase family protein [Phycisphaerae bacterium]
MADRTKMVSARVVPRFAGPCTFLRFPTLAEVVAPGRAIRGDEGRGREAGPIDWVIYGVPHDAGVTYRPGARFGPRAVRAESQYIKRYSMEHGVDVCQVLSLADGGDAPVRPYELKGTLDSVVAFARRLGDRRHTRLLAVGGDHSVAYANIRATWERRGKPRRGLALLHFDSHLDTVDSVWGERWGHASVFVRAVQDGLIDPRAMLSVGIKGPLNAAADLEFAHRAGVTVLGFEQWRRSHREGAEEVRGFVERLAGRETYLTFDVDVVDPAFAPGTGTPSIGGFTSAEALGILRSLRGANLVGADVVEVLPDRDPSGITALLAAQVVFEILALDAVRREGLATAPRVTTGSVRARGARHRA